MMVRQDSMLPWYEGVTMSCALVRPCQVDNPSCDCQKSQWLAKYDFAINENYLDASLGALLSPDLTVFSSADLALLVCIHD